MSQFNTERKREMSAKLLRVWNGKKLDATAVISFAWLNYVDNPDACSWWGGPLTELVPGGASGLEHPYGNAWIWAQFFQRDGAPAASEALLRRRVRISWLQASDQRSPQ